MSNKYLIYRYIIAITLYVTYSVTLGQSKRDSLLDIIANNQLSQAEEVKALNTLAYEYRVNHPDSSLILGTKSLQIAQKINDQFGIGNAKLVMATAQTSLGNYYEAIRGFREARLIFEELKETERIASCLNNVGALYNSINEFDLALDYFLQALALYEQTKENNMISASINNIGYIYKMKADYDNALVYLYRALHISKQSPIDYALYPIYNIGSAYMHKDMLDSGESYLNRALDLSIRLKDNYILTLTLMDLGVLRLKKDQILQAEELFLEANKVANKAKLRSEQLKSVRLLSEVYEKLDNTDRALKFHKLFKNKNDSLYNIDLNKKISFLEAQSKLNEDEIKKEIARKEKEMMRDNELSEAIWIRNTLILAFLLMSIISYLLYKNVKRRQLANQDLREFNSKIKIQSTELMAAYDEITVMNTNLEALVEERAKEITIKNRKLKEYLSSNSHIVRAPLARILGLIQLFDPKDTKNIAFISNSIHKSAKELDNALRDINRKLSDD